MYGKEQLKLTNKCAQHLLSVKCMHKKGEKQTTDRMFDLITAFSILCPREQFS